MTNPNTLQDARAIRHQTQFADPARTEDNGNGHPFGRYLNISITFGNLTIPQPFPLSFWYLEDATILGLRLFLYHFGSIFVDIKIPRSIDRSHQGSSVFGKDFDGLKGSGTQ
jgi:hypothetical protein